MKDRTKREYKNERGVLLWFGRMEMLCLIQEAISKKKIQEYWINSRGRCFVDNSGIPRHNSIKVLYLLR